MSGEADYLARKAARLEQRYKAQRKLHAHLAGRNSGPCQAHAALAARCEQLRREAEEQRGALEAMRQSGAWRLVCRARRVKDALLPPHTRRGRLARRAWQRLRNLL